MVPQLVVRQSSLLLLSLLVIDAVSSASIYFGYTGDDTSNLRHCGGITNQKIAFAHGVLLAYRINASVILPAFTSRRTFSDLALSGLAHGLASRVLSHQ